MVVERFRAWSKPKQIALAAGLGILLLGLLLWWRLGERAYVRLLLESPGRGQCEKHLSRPVLDRSIALGTRYVLAHQRPEGNFDYEYDWREKSLSGDDNEVRQAGALWGLTLLYASTPTPELAAAIERGLGFFEEHSKLVKGGARCSTYPTSNEGITGTVALIALAHTDYLRARSDLPSERRALLEQRLGEYLKLLVRAVHSSGRWFSKYDLSSCKPRGEPSPYSDGEALLALVKAAKYLGHQELLPTIMTGAAAGKALNIEQAREQDADSDVTKGYYQWSSMAFFELATSDFPDTRVYGDAVLELADWIIDTHHILTRTRNTGYAFEGIVHAYVLAKQRGDARQAKFGCAIDIGLERLIGWQVGGPLPNRVTGGSGSADPKALGGVQNAAFEPGLRIDVVQHQMHATLLARKYVY
jgi:UDP-N-acetylmuramoyl-tripeptide--D-alanyl-D-alanine ligase